MNYLAGFASVVAGVVDDAGADFLAFLFLDFFASAFAVFLSAFVDAAAAGADCAAGADGAPAVPWASATDANAATTNATITCFILVPRRNFKRDTK